MTLLILLFFLSLVSGQLVSWSPGPGISIYPHDMLLVIVILSAYFQRLVDVTKRPLMYPIMAFLFTGVASLVVNVPAFGWEAIGWSSMYLVRWFLYAELYSIVVSTGHIKLWIPALYCVGVVFGIVGLFQYFLYPDLRNLIYLGWDPHYYRLFSTFLDPNFAGIILVLGFLLGVTFIKNTKHALILFLPQIVLFAGTLLTYSRSSYIAFLVGVSVFGLMTGKRSLIFGLLAIFFGAIAILPLRDMAILRLDRAESAVARIGNWKRGVELISQRPILGFGFNTLRFVANDQTQSHAAAGLDNSFQFLLATTGVVGFGAYLWILATIARGGKSAVIPSLAAIIIHAQFINSLFYPWVMIWIWILAGAIQEQKLSVDT